MIGVTGANGLVGSFIVKRLVDEGHSVAAIIRTNSDKSLLFGYLDRITIREADVLDVSTLNDAFLDLEAVVHTAAIVTYNPRKSRHLFDVNVEGTRNVVNLCLALGIKKLIHISSVAALGRLKDAAIINEESKWIAGAPVSDYAESKYRAELEVYRGREEGLNVALVSPSVVLGPGDWDKSSSRIFRYIWKERQFYTEGALNYVDARDVADMVLRIYRGTVSGEKFIASAGSVPLKSFFDAVATQFGKKPPGIRVGRKLAILIARMETVRCWLGGREPLITKQTARLANEKYQYTHQKAVEQLGMSFHSLEETLKWCCASYLRNVTTNK